MVIPGNITHTRIPVNEGVFISPLRHGDAEAYWHLYQNAMVQRHFLESPFLPNETVTGFIKRIMLSCDHIWSIRKSGDPHNIIGDCALHGLDEQTGSITIGCALLPEHWGEGIMTGVMKHVIDFAKTELELVQINAYTSKYNDNAIRLMQRLGFIEKAFAGGAERQFQLRVSNGASINKI